MKNNFACFSLERKTHFCKVLQRLLTPQQKKVNYQSIELQECICRSPFHGNSKNSSIRSKKFNITQDANISGFM